MNTVYTAADVKKITVLVGLDISAAFDTIDHDVLASRFESQFSVVGAASSWLRSYLRSRQQFVRLGRHSSPMTRFTARPAAVHCLRVSCWRADRVHVVSYHQFADDTQLLVSMNSTTPRRPSRGSSTAWPQFASGSCRTASNSTLTSQRWSFSAPLLSSAQLLTSSPSTLLEALCRSHRSSSRLA